jgi:uncharacterized protein (DUF924 family)
MNPRAKLVLDYWFGNLDHTPEYFKSRNKLWFMGGDTVDTQIREQFERDVIDAVEGRYDTWLETPKEALALIILLDQFSLNLYREQPRSYEQSAMAIPIAKRVIANGWEYMLTPAEKVFLYLPLEHSEDLKDQMASIERFKALVAGAPAELKSVMDGYLDYAFRHWRVVAKYGRFPDRNEVYGRENRPEEVDFLASDEAPF